MTEFGLGLQTDKRPGSYAPLARLAEDGGFDVVTAFNDLWFSPHCPRCSRSPQPPNACASGRRA